MYRPFFGLSSLPFKTTPELQMFYKEGSREQILEALLYTVSRGDGIVKVTGEVGSGKTMLLRLLASRLSTDTEVIYINSPNLSAKDILLYICNELNIDTTALKEKFSLTNELKSKLVDLHARGKHVVMLVDEAQAMTFDALEEVRLLSNLETNDDKLLQMVLFGQPELDVALDNNKVRQIKSRITYSIYVPPLNAQEVHAYLNYRMRQAGYVGLDVFSFKIAKKIQKLTDGLPRNINVLADKILMACFGQGDTVVKSKHLKNLPDLELPRKSFVLYRYLLLLILLILPVAYYFYDQNIFSESVQAVDSDMPSTKDDLSNSTSSNSDSLGITEKSDIENNAVDELHNEIGLELAKEVDKALNQVDLVANHDHSLEENSDETTLGSVPQADKNLVDDGPKNLQKSADDEFQYAIRVNEELLQQPFLYLHNKNKLEPLLTKHLESKRWLVNENSRYVIQLSTRNLTSLESTLSFYRKYEINSDLVHILIDFNPKSRMYRLKVFYYAANSFYQISEKLDSLPDKVKREGPFIVKVSSLEQKLHVTEQELKQVGIINE